MLTERFNKQRKSELDTIFSKKKHIKCVEKYSQRSIKTD